MAGAINYKVMVSIMAVNGVAPVLRVIARDVLGLGKHVDDIAAKFGKWRLALAGVGTLVSGVGLGLVALETKLAKVGDKIIRQQALMATTGYTPAEISAGTALAERTALSVRGTTTSQNMELLNALRQALGGFDEASGVLQEAAKSMVALKWSGLKEFGTPEAMASILKALDITGAGIKTSPLAQTGGVFDPQQLLQNLQALVKFELLTRGLLKPQEVLNIARAGGWTAQGQDFRQWLMLNAGTFMELGSRAGYGLGMADIQFEGGKASWSQITALRKYGMIQQGGWDVTAPGRFQIKQGALYGWGDMVSKGLEVWIKEDLVPKLREAGVKTRIDMIQALTQIVGSVRALRYVMTQATPQGMTFSAKEAELVRRSYAAPDPYIELGKTYEANMDMLKSAWEGFLEVFGATAVPTVTHYLRMITDALLALQAFTVEHPGAAETINKIFISIGMGLTALGAAAVLTALVSLAGPAGLIAALGFAIIGLASAFDMLDFQKLSVLIGMTGGSFTGWKLGSFFGPLGGLIGAGVGGAAGAVGGYYAGRPSSGLAPSPNAADATAHAGSANLHNLVRAAAAQFGLDQDFMEHLAQQESGYAKDVVYGPRTSSAGAAGLMQVMPGNWKAWGIQNPFDPVQSARGGAYGFSEMLKHYDGDYTAALIAWNASARAASEYRATHGTNFSRLPKETQALIVRMQPFIPKPGVAASLSPSTPRPANVLPPRTYSGLKPESVMPLKGYPTLARDEPIRAAAVPAVISARSDPDKPIPVVVINGRHIAEGVAAHQARKLGTNPSGSSGFNLNRGFFPPGLAPASGGLY